LQAGYFESRATSDLEDRTIAATEGTHTIAQDTMDLAAYVVLGPSGGRKDAELWLIIQEYPSIEITQIRITKTPPVYTRGTIPIVSNLRLSG